MVRERVLESPGVRQGRPHVNPALDLRGRLEGTAGQAASAAACHSQWTVELLSTTALGLLLSQSDGMFPPNDRM